MLSENSRLHLSSPLPKPYQIDALETAHAFSEPRLLSRHVNFLSSRAVLDWHYRSVVTLLFPALPFSLSSTAAPAPDYSGSFPAYLSLFLPFSFSLCCPLLRRVLYAFFQISPAPLLWSAGSWSPDCSSRGCWHPGEPRHALGGRF